MISRVKLSAVAAVCVLALQAGASETATVLAKPGVNYDGRIADLSSCGEAAHLAPLSDLPPPDHPAVMPVVVGGGIGGVLGSAIAAQAEVDRAIAESRKNAKLLCMHNLGYVDLPLTSDEAAARRRADEDAWDRTFLATDLSTRLAPLLVPKVPPLPGYRDGPWMHGGLKIDADSLVVAAAEIENSGDIVTGQALRLRTAVLVTPIQTREGEVRVAADVGTIFHQADYRVQTQHMLRNENATWCGPVREQAAGNEAKTLYCFTGGHGGYEVFRPTGEAWFAGPYKDGFRLPLYDQPIRLEERTSDDLGPLDFAISVTAVSNAVVRLEATLRHDGKNVQIWNRDLVFDSKSKAYLPLWNMRVVLTHTSKHVVKIELDHGGDGHGWKDGD